MGFADQQSPQPQPEQSPLEKVLYPNDNDDVRTDAVIIYKNNKIVYENYSRGYSVESKHLSWSVAKTISGILIGIAHEEKILNIQHLLSSYFSDFIGNARIIDLLQMSSAIDFQEIYSGVPVNADVTRMLYLDGPSVGFANYVVRRPLRREKPGDHFYYSSGDTNVLMAILKKSMKTYEYEKYPWEKFFNRLNIQATFEQDNFGNFVGSSYIYMTARDFLKVGLLLMNKGVHKGEPIIPKWYFQLMNTVAPGVKAHALPGTSQTRAYSAQVTTNRGIPSRGYPPEYPDLPLDSLLLIGHQGQFVVASPSEKLVIVRLATDKGAALDRQAFFQSVRQYLKELDLNVHSASQAHPELFENQKQHVNPTFDFSPPWNTYRRIPRLINRLIAKEYCSCRFVVKRTAEQCEEDLDISTPVFPFISEETDDQTIVSAYFVPADSLTAKAQYLDDKLGCRLLSN